MEPLLIDNCGNVPGISLLWYNEFENLFSIPEAIIHNGNYSIKEDIVSLENKPFKRIEFITEDCKYEENTQDSPHGLIYINRIKGTLPKNLEDQTGFLSYLSGSLHIVVFVDQNNQLRVLGNKDKGCRFIIERATGAANGSDINATFFKFEITQREPAYWYKGSYTIAEDLETFIVPEAESGPFIITSDGVTPITSDSTEPIESK